MRNVVEVAFVVVPFVAIKFARKLFVPVNVVAKRFVDDAFVVVPALAVYVLRYALFVTVSAVVLAKPRVVLPVVETKRFWKVGVAVKIGPALNTAFPVPVSSVSNAASSALVSMLVEETLLLKDVQSVDVRHPNAAPVAVMHVSAFVVF